jgi:hypothetical protein
MEIPVRVELGAAEVDRDRDRGDDDGETSPHKAQANALAGRAGCAWGSASLSSLRRRRVPSPRSSSGVIPEHWPRRGSGLMEVRQRCGNRR